MFKCDTDLKFTLAMLDTERSNAVGGILVGHNNKNDDEVNKAFEEYNKFDRLMGLGLKLLVDVGLKEFDWKYAAAHGWLCEKDFEWFNDELTNEGIFKNDYLANWKEWEKEWNRKHCPECKGEGEIYTGRITMNGDSESVPCGTCSDRECVSEYQIVANAAEVGKK